MAGRALAEALRNLGLDVKLSHVEFGRGAEDSVWLPEIGQRGWILLTKDRAIRRRKPELNSLRRARVRAFFFASGDLTSAQMIRSFRKALHRIARAIEKEQPPFLKRITPSGELTDLE